MATQLVDPEGVYPPCRCGRAMVKLNAASDDPKCPCGQVSEECRCSPVSHVEEIVWSTEPWGE